MLPPGRVADALSDPDTLDLALLRLSDADFARLELAHAVGAGGKVAGGLSGDERFDAWVAEHIFGEEA